MFISGIRQYGFKEEYAQISPIDNHYRASLYDVPFHSMRFPFWPCESDSADAHANGTSEN
jgi:hypothetical protein